MSDKEMCAYLQAQVIILTNTLSQIEKMLTDEDITSSKIATVEGVQNLVELSRTSCRMLSNITVREL